MSRLAPAPITALFLSLAVAGCTRTPAPPEGTGAEEAARAYGEAIVKGNWTEAYAALDPTSRAQVRAQDFGRQAAQYRAGLGFEPQALRIRSCEEHSDQAIAHVVFTGPGKVHQRYQDTFFLRRTPSGWGVVAATKRMGRS